MRAGSFVRSRDKVWKVLFCAEDAFDDNSIVVVVAKRCDVVRRSESSYSLIRATGVAELFAPQSLRNGECLMVIAFWFFLELSGGAHRCKVDTHYAVGNRATQVCVVYECTCSTYYGSGGRSERVPVVRLVFELCRRLLFSHHKCLKCADGMRIEQKRKPLVAKKMNSCKIGIEAILLAKRWCPLKFHLPCHVD